MGLQLRHLKVIILMGLGRIPQYPRHCAMSLLLESCLAPTLHRWNPDRSRQSVESSQLLSLQKVSAYQWYGLTCFGTGLVVGENDTQTYRRSLFLFGLFALFSAEGLFYLQNSLGITMLDYHEDTSAETDHNPYLSPLTYEKEKQDFYQEPIIDWAGVIIVVGTLFCIGAFTILAILARTRWLQTIPD